jgi:hypothetical protein
MEDARHRHLPTVQGHKVLGIVPRLNFKGVELDRLDEETGLRERICNQRRAAGSAAQSVHDGDGQRALTR